MPWEVIAEELAFQLGKRFLLSIRRTRFISCAVINPRTDIRVAFSALMRFAVGGKFVLVRNLHRPETFSPFGGVVKYYPEAQQTLDELQFKPQDWGPGDDMSGDLRGFLPRKNLSRLVRWFQSGQNRESAGICLYRELQEELREINLSRKVKIPPDLRLQKVRTVEEGPGGVPGEKYTQYRIFEVYEPVPSERRGYQLAKKLVQHARSQENLCIATAAEIESGRAKSSCVIGQPAAYIISSKTFRPQDPFFVPAEEDADAPARGS